MHDPLLETHSKTVKICHFFYPGNLTVTKTRYPNSYLIQATDCFGLDKEPSPSNSRCFFILHQERPSQKRSDDSKEIFWWESYLSFCLSPKNIISYITPKWPKSMTSFRPKWFKKHAVWCPLIYRAYKRKFPLTISRGKFDKVCMYEK